MLLLMGGRERRGEREGACQLVCISVDWTELVRNLLACVPQSGFAHPRYHGGCTVYLVFFPNHSLLG